MRSQVPRIQLLLLVLVVALVVLVFALPAASPLRVTEGQTARSGTGSPEFPVMATDDVGGRN